MYVARASGHTLLELLLVLVILGALAALGWGALQRARDVAALEGAARAVARELALAKNLAVSRRETIRLRGDVGGIGIFASDGTRLANLDIGRGGELPVDSVDIRPRILSFNARGHSGAGSIYLWRGTRGIRLVCNFLGRVRRESVSGA